MGYWHQRADERHDNPPSMKEGAICGPRRSWKTPGELGVSKSVECNIFLQCFDTVGWAAGWFVGGDDLNEALHDL